MVYLSNSYRYLEVLVTGKNFALNKAHASHLVVYLAAAIYPLIVIPASEILCGECWANDTGAASLLSPNPTWSAIQSINRQDRTGLAQPDRNKPIV